MFFRKALLNASTDLSCIHARCRCGEITQILEILELGINIWESLCGMSAGSFRGSYGKSTEREGVEFSTTPPTFPHSRHYHLWWTLVTSGIWGGTMCRTGWVLSHWSGQKQFSAQGNVSRWNNPTSVLKGPKSHRSQEPGAGGAGSLGRTASPLFISETCAQTEMFPKAGWRGILVCQAIHILPMMISTAQEMWLCLGVRGPKPLFYRKQFWSTFRDLITWAGELWHMFRINRRKRSPKMTALEELVFLINLLQDEIQRIAAPTESWVQFSGRSVL